MSRYPRDSRCLSRCSRLSVSCQRLHLLVTLAQVKDFDACRWVDFVHGIARSTTSLAIQVVTLHEHRMIAETSKPNVAFTAEIKLNAFAYVKTVTGGNFMTRTSIVIDFKLTVLFHFARFDGHCSKLPNRSDYHPKDQRIRRR